jgi:hypothetical protein
LSSNRRAGDHAPGAPEALEARTRHHIRLVGSVLAVNRETSTVASTTNGAANVSLSSIWIV